MISVSARIAEHMNFTYGVVYEKLAKWVTLLIDKD